jgi:hypothetical protein
LSECEEAVLRKGLNFAVRKPHSNLDIACAVEAVIPKLPRVKGMEFRWRIRSMLEKTGPPKSNISKQEMAAIKSLKQDKDIRILQADKGNCTVVLDEVEYKNKLNTLLQSGSYEKRPYLEDREKYPKTFIQTQSFLGYQCKT